MKRNYRVVFSAKKRVEIEKTEMPETGDDEVLVKTEVSQISTGTELTMLEANVSEDSAWAPTIKFPFYPGYSNVGTIVEVGKNVEASFLGRRVLALAGHVKYFKLPINSDDLMLVPDGVEPDEAVFGVIAQITSGSVRISGIQPGDTVAVFGAGLIGQFVSRFAKLAGAIKIFVADVSDMRLNKLPGDPCFIKVNTMIDDIAEVIKNNNNGELARVVFETTSVPALIEKEIGCLAKRGLLIITSSPKAKSVIDFDYISRRGITIIGAQNFAIHTPVATPEDPWTRKRDSEYYLELLDKKQLFTKDMITHRASFKDAPDIYKMLMEDRTRALAVHLYWGN